MEPARGRLSGGIKAALLDTMRKAPVRAVSDAGTSAGRTARHDTSFESLPAYQHLSAQRRLADAAGVSPSLLSQPRCPGRCAQRHRRQGRGELRLVRLSRPQWSPGDHRGGRRGHRRMGQQRLGQPDHRGRTRFHHELEGALSDIYEAEASLVFVSGHATAISTIAALLGPKDLILHDQLIHNCVVVGAQLCGATRRRSRITTWTPSTRC